MLLLKLNALRPHGTTLDDEIVRHGRLIALVAQEPPRRRLQHLIDCLAQMWRPPDHQSLCMGGRVHWRVRPAAEDVLKVARHLADPRLPVRRAVLFALVHVEELPPGVAPALQAVLESDDAISRIQAAKAAKGCAVYLKEPLRAALADPVWMVRWHAATALSGSEWEEHAAQVLASCVPRQVGQDAVITLCWIACARPLAAKYPALAEVLRKVSGEIH
jgi:hypothetical protein